MDALITIPVRRVPFSADIEKPGDYCFIGKRQPVRSFEPVAVETPLTGWRRGLYFLFTGKLSKKRQQHKEIVEIVK